MKLLNETPFHVRAQRSAFEPHAPFLSVAIKGTFSLVPGGDCKPLPKKKQPKLAKAENFMDEVGNSRMTDADTVPYKPHADCIFIGSAFAPNGRATPGIEVGFGVGEMRKRLAVWGDRFWVREAEGGVRVEGPNPFTELPIRNELAHGGPTSKYNRHGIGFGDLPMDPGAMLQAANIMPINEGVAPWDRDEEPAGFGVLSPDTLPRRALAGTHDADWLYRRRPLPPRDFNVSYLNGARLDQQVNGFLRGDEEIYLENLHPKHQVLRSKLPGLVVRCFVHRTIPRDGREVTEFAEILTNLDTCIVDATDELVTLLWRGTLAIVSRKLERVHYTMIVTEPIGQAKSREFYLEMMNAHRAKHAIPKPQTGISDEQKKKIEEMNRKGIDDVVATLKKGGADEALIAKVHEQPNIDAALNVMKEYVEEIQKTLPPPPEQ